VSAKESDLDRERRLRSVRVSADRRMLYTHGIYVGTISLRQTCPYDLVRDVLNNLGSSSLVSQIPPENPSFEAIPEIWGFKEEVEDIVLSLTDLYNRAPSEWQHPINTNTSDGTIFVTGEGDLGGSYHPDSIGIQAGDILVALFGVEVPFILRPILETSTYQMLNVANMPGWGLDPLELRFTLPTGTRKDFAAGRHEEYAIV
jgi:hypothetical protein